MLATLYGIILLSIRIPSLIVPSGSVTRRISLTPLVGLHTDELRYARNKILSNRCMSKCPYFLKRPFPVRIFLLVLLVFYWSASIYMSVTQPPAVWRVHCMSPAQNTSPILPSFCDRMHREDQYFPFSLLPFKIPKSTVPLIVAPVN